MRLMMQCGSKNGFMFQEEFHGKYAKALAQQVQSIAMKDSERFGRAIAGRRD